MIDYTKQVKTIFFWMIAIGLLGSMILLYAPSMHTKQQIQENIIESKPTTWRRLNSNGKSQRYIPLQATGNLARINELLEAYNIGNSGESIQAIKVIARIHHIYPEVITCIAYADSSLGKYLKTAHNYGNVGNNDRGDTKAYTNFEQWIDAIGRTLNNRNLGKYISIDQLSRFGNSTGMIYASSIENWHINVLNCIGMIRGKRIPDQFAFRF